MSGGIVDIHGVWGRNVSRRQQPEAALQRAVAEYLARALPVGSAWHHSPGEGKRSKASQLELGRNGFCKGWPDLEVVHDGRIYFIELKAGRGIVSAAQRETHKRLLYAGAPVMVCRSIDDVEAGLRECGLHLRASTTV